MHPFRNEAVMRKRELEGDERRGVDHIREVPPRYGTLPQTLAPDIPPPADPDEISSGNERGDGFVGIRVVLEEFSQNRVAYFFIIEKRQILPRRHVSTSVIMDFSSYIRYKIRKNKSVRHIHD